MVPAAASVHLLHALSNAAYLFYFRSLVSCPDMDEATWKSTTADGTGKSLSNITGLPGYMISNTAEQVTEDSQEPIKTGGRKMLEGWVQKQVGKEGG